MHPFAATTRDTSNDFDMYWNLSGSQIYKHIFLTKIVLVYMVKIVDFKFRVDPSLSIVHKQFLIFTTGVTPADL